MITLRNISKIYRLGDKNFYALDNINLDINKGEFVAIRGASGSGKTTLLNIIGCLDLCTSGEYLLDKKSVGGLSDAQMAKLRNSQFGFVLQDFALVNNQTVLYNVMLPLLFSDAPFRSIKERALKALKMVKLSEQASKKASQLSGGQRQRVAIARAMIVSPSIILADEPTGQLDSKTGLQIMHILSALNRSGVTVIMVTHDEQIASFASRQIILSDGKIISDYNAHIQ